MAVRRRLGISQTDMAAFLNVSRSTLSRWERSKVEEMPAADVYLAWCLKLGVNVRFGMGLSDDPALPHYLRDDQRAILAAFEDLDEEGRKAAIEALQETIAAIAKARAKPDKSRAGGTPSSS